MELASDFDAFVKRNKWVTRYDVEADSFSATAPRLSNDARIKYIDKEIALYLTKDNKLEGVFIEYFGSNFVKHHRGLGSVLKEVERAGKTRRTNVVVLSSDNVRKIAPNLEQAISASFAQKITSSIAQPA